MNKKLTIILLASIFLTLFSVCWADLNEEVLTVKKIQLQKSDGTYVTLTAEEVEQLKKVLDNQEKLTKVLSEFEEASKRAKLYGQLVSCKNNLRNLGTACEMYASDNSGRYPKRVTDLVGGYVKELPKCPLGGTYEYSSKVKPDSYTWACPCEHAGTNCPKGYPRYDSSQGLLEKP